MSIRRSTLPNGLRVLTDAMDTVETTSVGAWIGVGTRDETPAVNGVSHLLEHMAFKGTARRSAYAISEEIESVGGHLNAYTAREHTAYYAKVLAEDAPLAIDILADILQNSLIDADELDRERAVVLQEIHQANDTPDDVVFENFQAVAYPDQPMGRSVLGSVDSVKALSRGAIADYLGARYTAGAMVVAAAGRIDHDVFVDYVGDAFGQLGAGTPAAGGGARYGGGERRETRDLEQVHFVLGLSGFAYDDPDFYALSVASMLFGGGMSSRLFQELREKRGLVYSVYSFAASYSDSGLFGIYAGTGADQAEEAITILCAELIGLAEKVSAAELDRARAQIKSGILMGLESTTARCERLGQQMLVHGRVIPLDEVVAKIEAVDEAAVRGAAARLLASPLSFSAVGPTGQIAAYDSIAARLAQG